MVVDFPLTPALKAGTQRRASGDRSPRTSPCRRPCSGYPDGNDFDRIRFDSGLEARGGAIPRTPRTRSPRIWASRSHLILTSRALLTRTCKVQRSRRITAREDMLSLPNMIRAWRHCSTCSAGTARGSQADAKPPLGIATHYYSHPPSRPSGSSFMLRVGDVIHIRGNTTDFRQKVESLEVNHAPATEVGPNDDFGLKVIEQRARRRVQSAFVVHDRHLRKAHLIRSWQCRPISALTAAMIASPWPCWSQLKYPRLSSHSVVWSSRPNCFLGAE